MDYRSRGTRGRNRRWTWWVLGGVLLGCPLVLWAVLSTLGSDELRASPVGKTLALKKPGVSVTKATLQTILSGRGNNRQFLGTDQFLFTPTGTRVKVTYREYFQNETICQVLIQSGKYKGRSGWVPEYQLDWRSPGQYKNVVLPADAYEIPGGMEPGDLPAGVEPGIPDGGIDPDK